MSAVGLLRAFRMRRAVRLYARRLPARLIRDYGAAETYNDAQITASVRRENLPEAGLRIARAAYMPAPEYAQKYGTDQAALRELFKSSLPFEVTSQHICGTSDAANVAFVSPGS